MKNSNLVFVYGTLMNGLHNNYILKNGNAELISKGVTHHSFVMLASSYNGIPFVVDVPSDCERLPSHSWLENATNVHGEIWACDDVTLERLDRLEGHPTWYKREKISIRTVDNMWVKKQTAWCYLMPMSTKDMEDTQKHPVVIRDGKFREINSVNENAIK